MITKSNIISNLNIYKGYIKNKSEDSLIHKFKDISISIHCDPSISIYFDDDFDDLFFVDYNFNILPYDGTKIKYLGEYVKIFAENVLKKIKAKKYKIYYKIEHKLGFFTVDNKVGIKFSIYFTRKNNDNKI